jgi:hypothetical protein
MLASPRGHANMARFALHFTRCAVAKDLIQFCRLRSRQVKCAVGADLDVLDSSDKWLSVRVGASNAALCSHRSRLRFPRPISFAQGRVLELDQEKDMIHVRYAGWDAKYDEVLTCNRSAAFMRHRIPVVVVWCCSGSIASLRG